MLGGKRVVEKQVKSLVDNSQFEEDDDFVWMQESVRMRAVVESSRAVGGKNVAARRKGEKGDSAEWSSDMLQERHFTKEVWQDGKVITCKARQSRRI